MAITIVQSLTVAAASSVTSLESAAFGSPPTNGNTIIVPIALFDGFGTVPTLSDTTGMNTYELDKTADDGSLRKCFLFRCTNIVGGSTFKITVTNDFTSAASATAAKTGQFSTTNADDLLIAFEAGIDLNGQTYSTTPTSFTGFGSQTTNAFLSIDARYRIVAAPQTNINPSWDPLTTGSNWVAIGFAYKAAAATGNRRRRLLLGSAA